MAKATAVNICPGIGSMQQYKPMANAFDALCRLRCQSRDSSVQLPNNRSDRCCRNRLGLGIHFV